ncbi:hypothetical protein HN51_021492 [Arachis hypogaea]
MSKFYWRNSDKLERSKVKKQAAPEAIFRKASSISSLTTTIHVNSESKSIEKKVSTKPVLATINVVSAFGKFS